MAELIHLLSNLTRSDSIGATNRAAFNTDPAAFLRTYYLTPQALAAFLSMDKTEMICVIEEELEDWQFPINESYPHTDPLCAHVGETGLYPDPQPRVYEITAKSGAIKVTAQGLVLNATQLVLLQGGVWTALVPTAINGTFRCADFSVNVKPGMSGDYIATVRIGILGEEEFFDLYPSVHIIIL